MFDHEHDEPRTPNPEPCLSEARLAANRANARKSTGPRTPEGKARSSQNALRYNPADVEQALEQDARVERIPRMTAKDGTEAPLSADQRKTAIGNLRRFIIDKKALSASRLAKMAGVSSSSVSELLHGKYRGDVDALLRKCEAVVNEMLRREDAPEAVQFVETRIAQRIFNIVKMASKQSTMAAFYAVSGIGKSMALRACVRQDFPSAILLEINPGNSSPKAFLVSLLQAIAGGRVSAESYRSLSALFNAVKDRLMDSSRLIIIDEADGLQIRTLNVIRQLHDATGDDKTRCPIVLAGRPNLQGKLRRTLRDEDIGGSLLGRLTMEYNLMPSAFGSPGGGGAWLFSVGEVMKMLARSKIRFTKDAATWLCALANISLLSNGAEMGGLRYAMKLFTLAATLFPDQEISRDLLQQVNRITRDDDSAAVLEHQVDNFLRAAAG
jgi:DNA transposition AAA+ family ATPase